MIKETDIQTVARELIWLGCKSTDDARRAAKRILIALVENS